MDIISTSLDVTARNLCNALQQLIEKTGLDLVFTQKGGIVHTVRWEPEEPLNTLFKLKQMGETIDMALEAAVSCELGMVDGLD